MRLKSYTSVLATKDKIDLAVIIIPAKLVPQAVEECGMKGTKCAVIISAGFSEVGKTGKELEDKIVSLSKQYGIRILGPNCLGYIDTTINLNASFAPAMPKAGNVAVISQSGAVCTAILDWALASNIGFSQFFSLGNKSDITELDLLSYLENEKHTEVIISYLESVTGERDNETFRDIASRVTLKKPLIIFKAGTTEAGAKAISSHTGSLAGSTVATTALFKQSGVIRASSLEDMFDWAEAFSLLKLPAGNKVAVITNAGGPGVMTTDAIEKTKLRLAFLQERTTEKLRKALPPAANIHNPIDVIGDADAKRYQDALDIVETDKNVNAILVLLTPQTSTQIEETAKFILKKIKSSQKTIIPVFMGGLKAGKGIRIFENASCSVFEYPERAVQALEKITFCQSCETGVSKIYPPKILKIKESLKNRIKKLIEKEKVKSNLIAGSVADNILKQYGINVLESKLVSNTRQAIAASKKIGFPLVFKIDSPDITHKSDAGGVIVGVKNEKQAKRAYEEIIKNVKHYKPNAKINGVIIYEMVTSGMEFYIGAKRDPILGPLIGFGLGGIYVEILKDTSFRLAPLSEFDIDKLLGELKCNKIIEGARGKNALYRKGIVETLIKVSNLMMNHPEIQELDINPLKVSEKSVIAIDNRMIVG